MTELLGVEASYKNNYYHYLAAENIGSLPALLNRFQHYFDVRGTYQIQEHLTGFLGYQYSVYDYTSKQLLAAPTLADPFPASGDSRDYNSHYFYAGAEHAFTSQLNGSAQVGVQYTSYDHLHSSEWNPYVDVRGTYTYLPGSYVQLGFTHTRNATDRAGNGSFQDLTRDQESSTLLASLNHRITPAITGSVIGQYQHSTFNGGSLDGKSENYILLGLNLSYQINVNWAAEIGYNLDDLDSDVQDRGFTRNRVYGGVRANF